MTQTDASHPNGIKAQYALWFGIGFFLILSIPFLFWPFNPHPDERLYTVAAAEMIASGDYLVPKSETGALRLKKPLIPYYFVVAGFKTFGESVVGAKALMVLSASLIIALSYSLGRALGADQSRALIGAGIVGGHKIFFSTSNQHIPDMPLVLGISLALLGFVYILSQKRPAIWVYYTAWFGVAFAVMAKGMLVLVLLALYLPFRLLGMRSLSPSWHELLAFAGVAILAGSWFVYIALIHPEAFMAQFVGDQVASKVGFDLGQVFAGLLKTSSDLVLAGLPMLVGIVLAFIFGRKAYLTGEQAGVSRGALFLIAWCVVTVVVFAFSTQLYERYILPALPAFAALLALLSMRIDDDALSRGMRWAMRAFLSVPVLICMLTIALLIKFAWFELAAAVFGGVILLALMFYAIGRRSPLLMGLLGGASVMPLIAVAILPLHFVFLFPTAGQQIAQLNWAPSDEIVLLDDPFLADDIGLQIGGIDRFHYHRSFEAYPGEHVPYVIFLDTKHIPVLEANNYQVESLRILRELDVDVTDIVTVWKAGTPSDFIERHGEILYIAHSDEEQTGAAIK